MNTYILKNKNNLELEISTLGATILSLKVPDKNNKLVNVVVGLSSSEDYKTEKYLNNNLYLGATVGRYAGRISKTSLEIDGKKFPIHTKEGVHLHGGKNGFDKKNWIVENIENGVTSSITLSYLSEHLEEGYPGNLHVFVTYSLTENNELTIKYSATTDSVTHVNLTNHSYFNLNGEQSILNHELFIDGDFYLDVDDQLIPSGKKNAVDKTSYDFNKKTKINHPNFNGLDDTFILNNKKHDAEISSKTSGICMKVFTNQPAIVVYTPKNFKDLTFKDDVIYTDFPAICFETQHYPDSPNNAHFPTTLLKPGDTYSNETTFKFSVLK
ncbi:aldose epimerase family protein [Tenacibaculum sp. M341]|uniref:aldose epimerase family protein n=1 Tax=Tenacibaculum sp. M341 TaxID=2530339 RepID=UPI001047ABCD|nr:aldose epimerase family protein [Tenacibaculum sp. M341]TCI90395.1 galactose mutarotase [Tenacibaculum sp. M341]